MRLILWAFLAAVCGGCVSKQAGPSITERRTAIRAMNEREYRSSEGFRASRWGMTTSEVRALFPTAHLQPGGGLQLETQVDETPAFVSFEFVDDRLAQVQVAFLGNNDVRSRQEHLRDALSLKYGAPATSRDTAAEAADRVGQYRALAALSVASDRMGAAFAGQTPDPREHARITATAESVEAEARDVAEAAKWDFLLVDEWATTESRVTLTGRQSPYDAYTTLRYMSVHYAERLAAKQQQASDAAKRKTANDL